MSTALATTADAPLVTTDQLELIKRTVANGATADELKLYLFDCARQGVHPLDKLLHFTKRQGKYTPITSIDFMRTRAADSGEYAGSDDAVFGNDAEGNLDTASVTVWRLVQGIKCAFAATARWAEYCPEPGPSGKADVMWRKMPHTMLAKCAEALALRKGFPRQLAGLYAREEMDQAGSAGYSVEAPALAAPALPPAVGTRENASAPSAGDRSGHSVTTNSYATTQNTAPAPDDALRIARVDSAPTKNANVTRYLVTLSNGEQMTTIKTQLAALCEQLVQENAAITVETKATKWGVDLVSVHRVLPEIQIHEQPVTADEIPFAWLLPVLLSVSALGGLLA